MKNREIIHTTCGFVSFILFIVSKNVLENNAFTVPLQIGYQRLELLDFTNILKTLAS